MDNNDNNQIIKEEMIKEKTNLGKEDEIIKKWKNLQDIILEEKSLIDVLFSYKNNDYSEIKQLINEYCKLKLRLRKANQNFIKNKDKEYLIDPKINILDNSYLKISNEIKNFLFFLRKNIDYIIKIILSINDNCDEFKIDSFVELICNQFYDNLPSNNNKHRQIMLIIYVLLEKEICNMDYAMVDNFLNTNYFLEKLLYIFCRKEEFTNYLNKILTPLLSSIEKEYEDKDILNLSLFEIKDYINNKNAKLDNKNNNHNKDYSKLPKIDYKELTKYIWRNCDEFVDDLTQKKFCNMIKEEKNIHNKELYEILFDRSFFNNNPEENIFSNNKFIELLNNDIFDNKELIINKYKQNYLFIHQKIDIFLLELINDIKFIPNNIRYICKIIYILISKKFPNLPKYLKNSFIGKFFFEQYIFQGLIWENKLIFENKIISFETKKCIGEIICILSHANKCLLFNNKDDTEKAIYNNYLIQIIPILDKFYNALIDIKLPKIFDKLINLKLKELESNSNKTQIKRKKGIKKINIINMNSNNYTSISKLIKENKKNHNKKFPIEKSLWNLEYIYFSLNDILFIISLINNNYNIFINLPKSEAFYNMAYNITSEISNLESLIGENENKQKFYIVYNTPINHLFENLKNYEYNKNFKKVGLNKNNNNLTELIFSNIKFSLKMLLQELDIISKRRYNLLNMAISNEKFFKYLYYSSLEIIEYDILQKIENKNMPIYLYGNYLINNINNLEKKYVENDYQELYNALYNEELYNLNNLRQFWDIIITKNNEKIGLSKETINKLKKNLEHIKNYINIFNTENIIFISKMPAYVRVDVINKNDIIPPIIVEEIQEESKKNEQNTLINNIEEFINIFSENSAVSDPKLKIKPYDLIILDIVDGKNENKIYDTIIKYLYIIKKRIKKLFPELKENEISPMIENIKDYILKSIFKLVFPKSSLKEDTIFYNKTQLLEWVTPENFSIKNIDFAQLTYAESLIKKFEDSKSIDKKLNYICNLQAYINNIFKFNTGKNQEIGQDEITPVLQYLIIKIQPRRIISNLNFIKCFLNDEDLISHKGFLMSQIDSAISFVLILNYKDLNVTEKEYNEKVEKARKKYNIKQ